MQAFGRGSSSAPDEQKKYLEEKVDEVVTAVAWSLCKPLNNKKISDLAVDATGLGNSNHKILKNKRKTLGLLRDLKNIKTVGVINEDKKKGIKKTEFNAIYNCFFYFS